MTQSNNQPTQDTSIDKTKIDKLFDIDSVWIIYRELKCLFTGEIDKIIFRTELLLQHKLDKHSISELGKVSTRAVRHSERNKEKPNTISCQEKVRSNMVTSDDISYFTSELSNQLHALGYDCDDEILDQLPSKYNELVNKYSNKIIEGNLAENHGINLVVYKKKRIDEVNIGLVVWSRKITINQLCESDTMEEYEYTSRKSSSR